MSAGPRDTACKRTKVRLQVWIEPGLLAAIDDALTRFRHNGRPTTRTDLVERLLHDGFRYWEREGKAVGKIEEVLAGMADHLLMTRAMQNALAFHAVGEDAEAYRQYLENVRSMKERIDAGGG